MKKYTCCIGGEVIHPERAAWLLENGTREDSLTCLKHGNRQKLKGIYSGEVGTSDIILCDKVYNDSVRSVFRAAAAEEISDTDDID